ncbi:hypothetical protein NQ315_015293 [Exocentrus adspersus]|uniref:E3 ubiquitin-protein ligase Sina-like RING finger domain-containing protein n=1 Tax=Exocentrus adspersus TaxID=1586481 RepID=A0AAV8VAI8_9CUCU|nr:hypothetical protein NQ315_015293 [Exocentrus adspersus]
MLECPVCKEYMHPPIYQCLLGHTMCNNCKSKADKCPMAGCEANIETTRNYILEDLSKKVELPQLEEKKVVKAEGGVKRNSVEDGDGNDTPSKIQKKLGSSLRIPLASETKLGHNR